MAILSMKHVCRIIYHGSCIHHLRLDMFDEYSYYDSLQVHLIQGNSPLITIFPSGLLK